MNAIVCRYFPVTLHAGAGWLIALAAVAPAQEAPKHGGPASYPAAMNKRFADPNADVRQFVKRFEDDSRDVYVQRKAITRSVGLRPGDAVADIGAGTGLFTMLFAEQVDPRGVVYAVDISPAMLKYIAQEAQKRGQGQIVKTVLNTQDTTELPPASIDVAFICDTYHHFERPERMLASIHRALRPEGRLIVIDFDLRKQSSDFVRQRARAPKETYFREIAAAGFKLVDAQGAPTVADNFYAAFRRVSASTQPK
jgi:ubiquinone/menaquinone biosynthesis C-methylase UbiE